MEKLEDGAFIRAQGLTSLVIPPKIDYLDYFTFLDCKNLQWVLFLGDAPELHQNAFKKCPKGLKVYYKASAKGFSSPRWNNLEAEACNADKIEELLAEAGQ